MTDCWVCWNSHGCALPDGHGGRVHQCIDGGEPCSMILLTNGEWIRWDSGERVGPVRAFHAHTDADVPAVAENE